jgi:hypothetical protein
MVLSRIGSFDVVIARADALRWWEVEQSDSSGPCTSAMLCSALGGEVGVERDLCLS